jgi:orotidine-5'-phosphate decarboxylase
VSDKTPIVGSAFERLIVALDQPSLDEALAMVDRLAGAVRRFKVGLELFAAAGPRAVEAVRALDARVFLDLKLHDIPETVKRAAKTASATGAELLTVHSAGGAAMLSAAVEGAGSDTKILAVTVLTSMDAAALARVGTTTATVEELVVKRALLAKEAGCAGVIASPLEAKAIRAATGPGFLIVTPGVRASATGDDQKRTATAKQAIESGADAVVVGRPVRDAPDPRAAAIALIAELSG